MKVRVVLNVLHLATQVLTLSHVMYWYRIYGVHGVCFLLLTFFIFILFILHAYHVRKSPQVLDNITRNSAIRCTVAVKITLFKTVFHWTEVCGRSGIFLCLF
jgi:hypothetical protein